MTAYCEFVSELIKIQQKQMIKREQDVVHSKYKLMLEVYTFFWSQFSSFLMSLNQKFNRMN
jgi:hypothetical protein